MTTRDPRIDPQPGDVTSGKTGAFYAVLSRDPAPLNTVRWITETGAIQSGGVWRWREDSAEDVVLAVAGIEVAEDAFPVLVLA